MSTGYAAQVTWALCARGLLMYRAAEAAGLDLGRVEKGGLDGEGADEDPVTLRFAADELNGLRKALEYIAAGGYFGEVSLDICIVGGPVTAHAHLFTGRQSWAAAVDIDGAYP